MKIKSYLTNGLALILIGILHIKLAVSTDAFGLKFREFASSGFFRISEGLNELPYVPGKSNTDTFAAFWFFYFGILLLVLGVFVHQIERKYKVLPFGFTLAYLLAVVLGSYMIPASGMTYIMLPHAIFMLVWNYLRRRKQLVNPGTL